MYLPVSRPALWESLVSELAAQLQPPQKEIEDPVEWIETHFFIPEISGPIQLQPYQRAVLREAYRRDEQHNFVYNIVLWSDIKKSGKSSIAAAVGLERARRTAWGSIKVVANDLKQADSRVAFYARRAVELNPHLREQVRLKPSGYTMDFPNRARIEAIPVDPKGEAGGNDDLIIFSELWAANQKAALMMWTEMTLSPTKFGQSQRWVETYAGYSGESPLLEQLYERGVKNGQQLELGIDGLEVFAEGGLLCLWNTQPRCPWQTPEYYAQEQADLTPGEYLRVHRNQWGSSVAQFVPLEWWDACKGDVPPLGPYESIVVAIDAAVSSDCFAIVAVSRKGEQVYIRYMRVWYPPKDGKIDFAEPEAELRRLAKEYHVSEFAYDPYQLEDMAMRLSKEGVGYFAPFSQGADRLVADKLLHDCILNRRITHSGEADLRDHIGNANQQQDKESQKLRIIKRQPALKIDACVTLSMANYRARFLNIG